MKRTIKTLTAISIVALIFTGCSSKSAYETADYNPTLKIDKEKIFTKISLENYPNSVVKTERMDDEKASVMCSTASFVQTAGNLPLKKHIENDLTKTLKNNMLYDSNSEQKVYVHVDKFTAMTDFGFSYWEFKVTLTTQTGYGYEVYSKHEFESHPFAEQACKITALEYAPAYDKLMKKIVKHPSFHKLFLN